MVEATLIVIVVLLLAVAGLQVALLLRKNSVDLSPIEQAIAGTEKGQDRVEKATRDEIRQSREEANRQLIQSREEANQLLRGFAALLNQQHTGLAKSNEEKLEQFRDALLKTSKDLRDEVAIALKNLQEDNGNRLELMRQTVDEKLQGTLERRLGESFKQVSERLEQVHQGLGEMQALASGVGDLKRVLTNVKTRGVWGEVQLAALLDQILTPEQYGVNIATKLTSDRVEFTINLPGRGDDEVVWLPIDSKFPLEDYQRLIEAQEVVDAEAAAAAGKQLEARVKSCARDICDKYLNPPRTTDFAIMFLPIEGLYAEAIRRTGLIEYLQRECRVIVAGPTTLGALLNSLQMGFRTLAIEKRSSEVWGLLASVKEEFGKYGGVLQKVQKKLQEASNTIEQAETRTRVIQRKLKNVEELPTAEKIAPVAANLFDALEAEDAPETW